MLSFDFVLSYVPFTHEANRVAVYKDCGSVSVKFYPICEGCVRAAGLSLNTNHRLQYLVAGLRGLAVQFVSPLRGYHVD